MKYLVLILFLFNFYTWANDCLKNTLQVNSPISYTAWDFSGSCLDAIVELTSEYQCSSSDIAFIANKLSIKKNIQNGEYIELAGSNGDYCEVVFKDYGFFQVMKNTMAEPPIATVIFSRWD